VGFGGEDLGALGRSSLGMMDAVASRLGREASQRSHDCFVTLATTVNGDGQYLPNIEVVAVRCRAGFSPISVTQKTTLVFWLPQREYREALAE
jgi:hypothetical protein